MKPSWERKLRNTWYVNNILFFFKKKCIETKNFNFFYLGWIYISEEEEGEEEEDGGEGDKGEGDDENQNNDNEGDSEANLSF